MDGEQVAAKLFGDRLALARAYAEILSSIAVERGLIGPREVPRLWGRHLLNCVVLQELVAEGDSLVDVGSGAGLPGIPLAIARPDLQVTLVEPLLRRATFLVETIAALGLDVTVHRGRAEDRQTVNAAGRSDVVVARAVAPLGKLVSWSLPLARTGGRLLALKGHTAAEEIVRARADIRRCGGRDVRVRECGVGILDQPATVVEVWRT